MNKEAILISVVVPVYNVVGFLPEFLKSAKRQIENHIDIELIFVNDGSGDGSAKLLEKFANENERVRLISQTNKGVSAARNAGLDYVSGEYLTFADPDDWLDNSYRDNIFSLINQGDVDIVSFPYEEHAGEKSRIVKTLPIIERAVSGEEYLLLMYNKKKGFQKNLWSKVYKTALINKNLIRFDEELTLGEDVIFNIKAFFYAKQVVSSSAVIYHHSKSNPSSITSQKDATIVVQRRALFAKKQKDLAESYCMSKKLEAKVLSQSLRALLRCANLPKNIEQKRAKKDVCY